MAFHIRYLEAHIFIYRLHNFSKLTLDEYKKGTWRVENYTEEKLFERVTPKLSDLLRQVLVKKSLSSVGDDYEKVRVSVDDESFEQHGIKITRKDYYKNLKTFCLSLR